MVVIDIPTDINANLNTSARIRRSVSVFGPLNFPARVAPIRVSTTQSVYPRQPRLAFPPRQGNRPYIGFVPFFPRL